jgi:hypothetical protein
MCSNAKTGLPSSRRLEGKWLALVSLFFFAVSTTLVDIRLALILDRVDGALILPSLVFVQGYVLWFYVYKFRPASKRFSAESPESAQSYLWAFVVAMVGTSIAAVVGYFALGKLTR